MPHPPPNVRHFGDLDGRTFLVCIGAMKCATSWVHAYMNTLEGLTVSPLKEVHFFDAKFSAHALGDMDAFAIKRAGLHLARSGKAVENLLLSTDFQASVDRMQMVYDDNAYFSHFARLALPGTRTFCDVTPAYSVLGPEGFAYMREFFATQSMNLKLLFILRDPVNRLWSQLRHLQEINPDGRIAERWAEAIESPAIMARADYAGTITDIEMNLPPENMLCLFYEDLFEEATLRRLCEFADVPYRPGNTAERRNKTRLEMDLPDEATRTFREVLSSQYEFCHDRFGAEVPAEWLH